MKKNPLITVYSIVVVCIFAGILLFSGVSLVKEYKKGIATSTDSFKKVTQEVKTLLNSSQIPNSANLTASGKVLLKDYAYINVKINRQDAVLFPQNAQEPIDNNKYTKVQRETFSFGDNTIYVCANVYYLSPSVIAYYCKLSFIVILIFTILTILIIVIKGLTESEAEVVDGFDYEESENIPEEVTESESVEKIIIEEVKETESESVSNEMKSDDLDVSEYKDDIIMPVNFSEIPATIEEPEVTEKENLPDQEESEENETAEETETVEEEPAVEETPLPVDDYIPENNPVGLYSEKTGFGWESYLKPRLENELIRATSSEFDLCLFIIKIADLSKDAPETKKISEILLSFFQFKDMVFEYKDDSYAAIKTNLSIDDAIKTADNLYSELTETLKETSAKCYIGLSSKTIRMVGAERILKEADAAVEHAQEDPEYPIIAFRANAEKYMEFVEKN